MKLRGILIVGGGGILSHAAIAHAVNVQDVEVIKMEALKERKVETYMLYNSYPIRHVPIAYPEKSNYLNGKQLPRSYKSKRK